MNTKLVIFSDLDASLLDHHTYQFDAALPALNRLKALQYPVILNSSKTKPEMHVMQEKMGLNDPFIVENGGAMLIPAGYFNNHAEELVTVDINHDVILNVLNGLADNGYKFRNFNRMSAATVSDHTQLSETDAALAKQRTASEPLLWDDTDEKLLAFEKDINSHHLKLLKGGRFYHVTGHFNKGTLIERLMSLYREQHPGCQWLSVGLGDSPNDIAMLDAVDIPVVINSPRKSDMPIDDERVMVTVKEGPAGWNDAMLTILDDRT